MKKLFLLFCTLFFSFSIFSATFNQKSTTKIYLPGNLKLFESCYPDLIFTKTYDKDLDDWKIDITKPVNPNSKKTKTQTFYWADGRLLPKENLKEKELYWSLLYPYDSELLDPEKLTEDEIKELKEYYSTEKRMNEAGSPMFFFEFLYDAYSEKIISPHIVEIKFLGCKTKVHERMVKPLKNVEKKINALSKTDKDVREFVNYLASTDAYFWRLIANTNRKSFHSYGIAIDCLPKNLHGKQTYWGWAKNKYGDNWMLTPFSDRWMPPLKVCEIFESEGFIWGGKWAIWDTMHFEYHPELIKYNGLKLSF